MAGQLFVPDPNSDSVTVYPVYADGNVPAERTLVGASTGLDLPYGVAIDREHGELFVSNLFPAQTVTVYDLDATGNVTPKRTLAGAATQLHEPIGLDVDTVHGELFVRNFGGSTILVFDRLADGNTPPLRVLSGAATKLLVDTADLAVDVVHNELVVVTRESIGGPEPGRILFFDRTATGNTPPKREISGASTGLGGAYGVLLDNLHDEVIVTNGTVPSIRVFPRTGSGNVAPLRVIAGNATGLETANPAGIALDPKHDELIVTSQGGNSLVAFARTAQGNVAPLRTLKGAMTGLASPSLLDLLPTVFRDGFENGNTTAWSGVAP